MITSLKDLEKLLKVCRKQGVTSVSVDGITIAFGDAPFTMTEAKAIEVANPYAAFPQNELTPEQLMYYSAGIKPEDDPEVQ